MKIIDSRSGKVVQVGETRYHAPGEGFTLHGTKTVAGKLVGDLTIYAPTIPGGKWRKDVQLVVRLTHPRYFLQRVAFIPT